MHDRREADYRYNHSDKGRERWRRYAERARQTPGTYAYRESHGLGVPGLKRYLRERKRELASQRSDVTAKLTEVRKQIAELQAELGL